jgi:CubicO group peptidase (beta-lactamase class C family)
MMTRSKLSYSAMLTCLCVSAFGQSSSSTKPDSDRAEERLQKVISCLPPPVIVNGEQPSCTTLTQRMTELHVPGVSIAVIHNGSIEWARGFGVTKMGGSPVTENTLFQAGSISKPVAAMAALHQVQSSKLSLDTDVNSQLIS